MKCPECGRSVREGLRLCPDCGADLPRMEVTWTCPTCGTRIRGRSRLCPMCGEEAVEGGRAPRRARPARAKKLQWSSVAKWWVEVPDTVEPAAEAGAAAEPARLAEAGAEPIAPHTVEPAAEAGGAAGPARLVEAGAEPTVADTIELAAEAGPAAEPALPTEAGAEPAATDTAELAAEAGPAAEPARLAEVGAVPAAPPEAPTRPAVGPEDGDGHAPFAERAAEAELPAEGGDAPTVTEPAFPKEEPARPSAQQEVGLKPLADRLARPVVALEPVVGPVAVAEAGPRPPAAGKVRSRRPGLLALASVVAAGALVAALLLYLRPSDRGLDLRGLLAWASSAAGGVAAPQPDQTEVPGVLAATQVATETPTPPPTETPTPTNTPVPPTAVSAPLVHTVQSDETLRSIAERYGVTIAQLVQANNLASDVIRLGQELVIPGHTQPTPQTGPSEPTVHVVEQGENLAIIAQHYSVPLLDLMAANGISDPNLIRVGQELRIPGQGESLSTTTAAPTGAGTATPMATVEPTMSGTITVTLTPTVAPTSTAAPYEFTAPNLLDPANGEVVDGMEGVVVNWTTVGLLDDRSWYVVKTWRDDPSEPTPATIWTRTTAVRIPASYAPAQDAASRRLWWSVTVIRAVEGEPPVEISPESEQRWFEWQ